MRQARSKSRIGVGEFYETKNLKKTQHENFKHSKS